MFIGITWNSRKKTNNNVYLLYPPKKKIYSYRFFLFFHLNSQKLLLIGCIRWETNLHSKFQHCSFRRLDCELMNRWIINVTVIYKGIGLRKSVVNKVCNKNYLCNQSYKLSSIWVTENNTVWESHVINKQKLKIENALIFLIKNYVNMCWILFSFWYSDLIQILSLLLRRTLC